MTDATEAIGMGTAAAASKRRTRKVLKNIPGFAYVLLIFIMIGAFVPNMREILFTVFGSYSLTWVEVIYLIATFTAMGELLRVSKPGIDNTVEALVMLGIGIVFLLLFVFGAMGVPLLGMFSTTEFLMLVLISGFQIGMAFLINARTLKRTFDTSAAHNDSDV